MVHFIVLSFLLLLSSCHSLSFTFLRFDPNDNRIVYEGDAVPTVGAIEFNLVRYQSRVGRATYAERLQLWDSDSGTLADFSTRFSFFIDTQSAGIYGDGLSFFLAPVGFKIPPNSNGGFLGLFNTTTSEASSRNQIVYVEFDSFSNEEWDPPYEHVGINNNSIRSGSHVRWNASLHSGETANVWITYNATTKNLSVYWTYDLNQVYNGESLLSYQVDLMQSLPEWVTIGFSAATGINVERHNLRSWEFDSSLNTKVTQGRKEERTGLVVGLVVPAAILIAVVGIVLILRRRRRVQIAMFMESHGMTGDFERGAGPKRFTYRELVSATNNFSDDRKLGEGGFGCVYKGFLSYLDMAVAVKKISRGSRQGKKEYITEVKTISQLRHRNLVQLMGWCHDRGEFLLVYEFLPNGSLDFHLFGKRNHLTWALRYKITLGIASALLYLHEEWEQCVVHRDIKASNVMLDSSFNAKLGDFGLARLMDHELGPQTTGLAGTLGYLAPEYINTGKASKESDVFSFGVVALEIVSGRKSVDIMEEESQMGLVEWVWDLHGRGKLASAVDEKLSEDIDANQVECLMNVGLWCAHPDHSSRPSIRQAIHVLHFESKMPDLPPKMPVASYQVPAGLLSSSKASMTSTSLQVENEYMDIQNHYKEKEGLRYVNGMKSWLWDSNLEFYGICVSKWRLLI